MSLYLYLVFFNKTHQAKLSSYDTLLKRKLHLISIYKNRRLRFTPISSSCRLVVQDINRKLCNNIWYLFVRHGFFVFCTIIGINCSCSNLLPGAGKNHTSSLENIKWWCEEVFGPISYTVNSHWSYIDMIVFSHIVIIRK